MFSLVGFKSSIDAGCWHFGRLDGYVQGENKLLDTAVCLIRCKTILGVNYRRVVWGKWTRVCGSSMLLLVSSKYDLTLLRQYHQGAVLHA